MRWPASPRIQRGEAGVIVTIGDYVDKGPHSRQVIDRLLSGVGAGWKLVALKGNHDAMMVEALRDPAKMAVMDGKGRRRGAGFLRRRPRRRAAQPTSPGSTDFRLLHVDAHRLYVHAGVDPEIPLDRQSEATLLWKRYPKGFSGGFGKLHVVHGHDNFPDGPLLYEGRTNLDTLAWRTGG